MKTVITSIFLVVATTFYAQKTYLKIQKDSNPKNIVSYPPGTEFELRNQHNYIILKDNKSQRVFPIVGKHTLVVFTSYEKKPEVIHLNTGAKVELVLTKNFTKNFSKSIRVHKDKQGITATTNITDSKKLAGKKNLFFELSNGIRFTYKDGKYNAKINDTYIDIKGKYLIKTKVGKLRLSFNPEDGQIWWLFEKNN